MEHQPGDAAERPREAEADSSPEAAADPSPEAPADLSPEAPADLSPEAPADLSPEAPADPSPEAPADLSPAQRVALTRRDEAALAAFFDAYFDRIYGYVRRLVGEDHLAEDLSQEIFLHIHQALPSYDPERALRPWVFTIATNKVRDFWRSRRHRESQTERSVERDGAAVEMASGAPGPEARLDALERDDEVRQAVDQLPEGMRLTVMLRVYEGLSFEAIGKIIDRNEVAVRKRYSRALEALRDRLGGSRGELRAEGAS